MLAICAMLAVLGAPATPATDVYVRQAEVIEAMNAAFPEVKVDVRWEPCGEFNGAYNPYTKKLTLCTETEQYPDVALFVAAHEMSHAILMQIADDDSEQDADEFAAIALSRMGEQDAVLQTAVFMAQLAVPHIPGDEHPGTLFRAWELACIEDGSEAHPTNTGCKSLYDGLVIRYSVRLSNP